MFLLGFSRPLNKCNIFSNGVRLFQGWTSFSHVYIKFYDVYYREWLIFEASHGTVHLVSFDKWAAKNVRVTEVAISMSKEEMIAFVKYAYARLQVKYSFLNIIGIFLKRVTGIKFFNDGGKAYICSELAAEALKNKLPITKDLDYVTPLDIYKAVSNA